MMNVCGLNLKPSTIACRAYAEALFLTVDNLGCPAYISAQSNACTCKYWIG